MPTRLVISGEVLDPDVVLSEIFSHTATATAHPVEEGAEIVDHVQLRPDTITIQALITESPIILPDFGLDDLVNRARAFIDRIKATVIRGELITLESARRGTINDLAMVGITEPYTNQRGVEFTLTLIQIRVVASRTIAIPPTLQPRGRKKKNLGKQPTEEQSEERVESLASKFSKSVLGF